MAQGAAKSALIYGTLGTALFITCEVCGTAPSTAPAANAATVQQGRCEQNNEAGMTLHTRDRDHLPSLSTDADCPGRDRRPDGD